MSMRIAELSSVSGVPIPSIKYYLREGLLPRGENTAPNQAAYDDGHVRRLRLIRVLLDIGKLSIADVRAVVDALEDDRLPMHELVGVAQYALGPHADADPPDEDTSLARAEIDAFIEHRRWRVFPDSPSRHALADALVALRRLGRRLDASVFDHYANVASDLASWELDMAPIRGSRSTAIENVVVGTVVFEAALDALRRLAHEDHSARRLRRRRAR